MKFEPVCFEHAARLLGQSPWAVSRDASLLATAQIEALKMYHADFSVVGLDIYNVEIEAYGCSITKPFGDEIPTAGPPPFDRAEALLDLELNPDTDGRIPMIFEAAALVRKQMPDVDVRIPVTGPVTIACYLLGKDTMVAELKTHPEVLEAALMHLAQNQAAITRKAEAAGFGVSIFEAAITTDVMSSAQFEQYGVPALKAMMPKEGAQLILNGDTEPILPAIESLNPAYIINPVETDQARFMERVNNRETMTVRVKMNPKAFLHGREHQAYTEADRVRVLAEAYRHTTIGTRIPYDADPDIVSHIATFLQ